MSALVFVDAVVPACNERHQTSSEMAPLLDAQTSDGLLARWLDWWPVTVVEKLLPSPADRELLTSDMPTVPRDTYDDDVVLPDNWTKQPCAYLQLSDAYHDDRIRATELGWTVRTIDSTHLGIITDPKQTLDAILGLATRTQ